MAAALQTLARFKRLADSREVDDIVAVATSAVREAPNGGDFLAAVDRAHRHPGPRHHRRRGGARSSTGRRCTASTSGPGTAVVIDIGGGSTEITLGTRGRRPAGAELPARRHPARRALRARATRSAGGDERRMVRHIRHELGDYVRGSPGPATRASSARPGTVLRARGAGAGRCRATSRFTIGASARRPSGTSAARSRRCGLDERLRAAGPRPAARRPDRARRRPARHHPAPARRRRADAVRALAARGRGARLHPPQPVAHRAHRALPGHPAPQRDRAGPALQLRGRPRRSRSRAWRSSIFDQTRPAHGLDDRAREWLDFAGAPARHRRAHQLRAASPAFVLPGEERRSPRVRTGRDRGDGAHHPLPPPRHPETVAPRSSRRCRARCGGPSAGWPPCCGWPRASTAAARSSSPTYGQAPRGLDVSQLAARGDVELEHWAAQRHAGRSRPSSGRDRFGPEHGNRDRRCRAGRAGGRSYITPARSDDAEMRQSRDGPHFQEELAQLKERLLAMGGLAEEAVRRAVDGLTRRDRPRSTACPPATSLSTRRTSTSTAAVSGSSRCSSRSRPTCA